MARKILFLSPQLPYPPVSGGTIKSWKLIEFLSKEYDVFAAYFLKGEDAIHQSSFLEKVRLDGYYSESMEVERNAVNFIRSNLLGIPLNLYRNRSWTFRRKIRRLAREYKTIFIDHYEMFQYVPRRFTGKVILHQHNCEYIMWDRFAQVEPSFARRFALKNQAWHIRRYERRICNNSNRVLAAPNDIEELKKIGAVHTRYLETFHLGDEQLLTLPELHWEGTEKALMFVGTLTWEANVDGLLWFLEHGWDVIRECHPDLKFYIIGKQPDQRIVDMVKSKGEDVVLTGFVKNLEDYFPRCRVFISPLRFGSGIKVKVMNAMYRGIPTVTTAVGAEGLLVEHRDHMMISDDMAGFTDSIHQLLTDRAKWEHLRDRSRSLARRKYTWDAVLDIVRQAVDE
jgi:glycosyltransferase involved in cell wall biosynthesis